MRTYVKKPCVRCGELYLPTGNCSKFCDECRIIHKKEQSRIRSYNHAIDTGRIKLPGVGSGGAQGTGNQHHSYKNGIGMYKQFVGYICEMCGSNKFLLVHHINHNRQDNRIENLQTLCKKCHQDIHTKRDLKGRYTNV